MKSKRIVAFVTAALLIGAIVWLSLGKSSRSGGHPNVVLIVVDTLAVRHLETVVAGGAAVPSLKKLYERGVVFSKAYSPSPWTKPAVSSIFTGLYPSKHHVLGLNDKLESAQSTMAEWFKVLEYATRGIVSHTLINGASGYSQGFDAYTLVKFKGNVHDAVTSDKVTGDAISWLRSTSEKDPAKPFFLFAHYFDPHYNYQHHPKFDRTSGYHGPVTPGLGIRGLRDLIPNLKEEDLENLRNLYREEISYTDEHIGNLLDYIESNIPGETIVILTADHGEEFMEHGFIGHTRTLYDELIHVPLVISWPGKWKAARVDTPVSTVDILPTLREILSTPPSETSGISLVPYLTGMPDPQPDRVVFAEVDFQSSHIKANKVGIATSKQKVVLDRDTGTYEYLDLEADPLEKTPQVPNLSVPETKVLVDELNEFAAGYKPSKSEQIKRNRQEIEQLKSLGYIN